MLWIHFSRCSGVGILCSRKSSFQCHVNKNDSGMNVAGLSQFTLTEIFQRSGYFWSQIPVIFFPHNQQLSKFAMKDRERLWLTACWPIDSRYHPVVFNYCSYMCPVYSIMFGWWSSSCFNFCFVLYFLRSTGPLKFPKISLSKESFQMSR